MFSKWYQIDPIYAVDFIHFNSFAANFLTILFSQCHIYFYCKGHSEKSSL